MSDDDEDPFENLDPPEDREGDPFERLGDVEPAEDLTDEVLGDDDTGAGDDSADAADETADSTRAPTQDGPDAALNDGEPVFEEEFIEEDDTFGTGPGVTPDQSHAGGTAASGGTESDDAPGPADPFDGMDGREGDPFGEGESAFESVDVESVDADEVWESLDSEPTPAAETSRYVEVSKHRFCEQCEHFSSPPNATCTHDEAELIEYLDMETVRLLNCPVVAEQRQLEDEG